MIGLENLKSNKIRVFKRDDRTQIKNFFYSYGKAILVMGCDLDQAFLLSFDSLMKKTAVIVAQSKNVRWQRPHALVKNELYIFGAKTLIRSDGPDSIWDHGKVRK